MGRTTPRTAKATARSTTSRGTPCPPRSSPRRTTPTRTRSRRGWSGRASRACSASLARRSSTTCRPDCGGRWLERTDRHEPTDGVEYTATWDRNLLLMATALCASRSWPRPASRCGTGTRARLLVRQLRRAKSRAERGADGHVADGQGRLRREGRATHRGAALELWPAAGVRLRQLRDLANGGAGLQGYVTSDTGGHFARDTAARREWRS